MSHGLPAASAGGESNPVGAYAAFEDDHWWFVARRIILQRLVRRLVEPSSDRLIVDVGCGPGGNLSGLASMYRCLGIDTADEAVRLARERFPAITFVCGVAPQDIAADAARADVWLLMDVLEHVNSDDALLQSLVAAAKPGAHIIITVPADPSLWSPHDDAAGHRRRYTVSALSALWDDLPVTTRLLSAYNARLYWPTKLVRTATSLAGRGYGKSQAEGLDLRLPPTPLNGILTALFTNEVVRLLRAIDDPRFAYRRGVSLIAVLRREEGEVPPAADVVPTSAFTRSELGTPGGASAAPTS